MKNYLGIGTNLVAFLLLAVMAGILFFGAWKNSGIIDELAHIPAGYSYATLRDLRLNPEHPPLVKWFSGVTARLGENFNFPAGDPLFQTGINEQWDLGAKFLYESGNNPDKLIFAARVGPIILTLLLGWFLFLWARDLLGAGWGLFLLFLFVFSPNFLAHGNLVTTDIGATLGVVVALLYFTKFLRNPTNGNLLKCALALGIAFLLKFTTLLLVPVLIIATVLWALITEKSKVKGVLIWLFKLSLVGLAAILIVAGVYQFLIASYPQEKQIADASFILRGSQSQILKTAVFGLSETPAFRGLGYYFQGLLMNLQRAEGGNTAYFLDAVSNKGWWYYFPVVYLLKEPLPLLILFFSALAAGLINLKKLGFPRTGYLRENFDYVVMLLFVVVYWASSIQAKLNIGIRHIFPAIILMWLLSLRQIKNWQFAWKVGFLSILAVWYLAEFFLASPHYLAYFNQLAGGPANGYKYVVDSNLDWGQDLKYLRDYVFEKGIPKIKVDYFGAGRPSYYLGERYEPLRADDGPQKGWVAVSATFLQTERGEPIPNFPGPCCRYRWLDQYEPVAKIGYSIFVYKIPE